MGGGLSAGSIAKTTRYGREDLQPALLEACGRSERGTFVTIDEIQKVPVDDVSAICNAFQMASRKGYDILLAVAGLPFAHGLIIHHEGCTYLRRAPHEEIGLFSWEEADEAWHDAFARVPGVVVGQEEIDVLNEESMGHPYLMQLLGFYLLTNINQGPSDRAEVSPGSVEHAARLAHTAYERRALKPLLSELGRAEVDYLRAMSSVLSADRLATTADIARELGTRPQRLSKARARLIDYGYIASPEYGKLMFCVPYLADYVTKPAESASALEVMRQRGV